MCRVSVENVVVRADVCRRQQLLEVWGGFMVVVPPPLSLTAVLTSVCLNFTHAQQKLGTWEKTQRE